MHIINSRDDIATYIDNNHYDFVTAGLGDALADAIQNADHPPYGEDWAEWLFRTVSIIRENVSEANPA
jgi:hypothetical protein